MKYWMGGLYLVMKSTPIVIGGRPLLAICYRYNSRKVLGFIANEGDGSYAPGDLYLSIFPDIYSNVSVCPVVIPHLVGRYFNACFAIDNHNRMWQSDLALEKYWVTHGRYFRLATVVALVMGIADGKLIYCHGVLEGNVGRKISILEYKNSTYYDCFNNPFTDNLGIPYLNIPPITFDDIPRLHKRARYIPYLLPDAISVASEISFSTLTTPSDSLDLLPSDDHNTLHFMNTVVPVRGRVYIGYCCRGDYLKMLQKDKVLLLHML